jgi:molybdopterin converting factor small subunit
MKVSIKLTILFVFCIQIGTTQSLSEKLFKNFEVYKEQSFKNKRFKQKDILPLIDKKRNANFKVTEVGKSFEKRPIFELTYGTGPIKIMLWSQMHGDEATATMALFDIFNFLNANGDEFDQFRKELKSKTTIYFIPMLNPDGTELYQRRTIQEIDMNRDALRLACPESKILKELQQKYCPDFAFNLHDQSPRILVGNSNKQSTLSFLASAYDQKKSINGTRKRAMQVIALMNKEIQKFIPGQISKYSDEHEPRAFGDNIQKWESSLILIESGGYRDDIDKMFIRKLNFVAMLTAFESMYKASYKKVNIADYNAIPQNNYSCYDILIKNVTIDIQGQRYTVDLGVNKTEVLNDEKSTNVYIRANIMDVGDLSIFKGLQEWDAKGATLVDDFGNGKEIRVGQIANLKFSQNKRIVKVLENGTLK